MDSNFTRDLETLEEYSLTIIDFFDRLPDCFFEDENLSPSKRIVDNILHQSKRSKLSPLDGTKLYRWN